MRYLGQDCKAVLLSVFAAVVLLGSVAIASADAIPEADDSATAAGQADKAVTTNVIEALGDDSDPEAITQEEQDQIGVTEIDSALPILHREPFLKGKRALDDMEVYLKENYSLQFTPEWTMIWQQATIGGSDNSLLMNNIDVPLLLTPANKDGSPGNGSLGVLFRQRDEFLGTTPRELADSIGINTQTNDTGLSDDSFTALLELWWEQRMMDDQLRVRFGRVDQGAYLDGNRYGGSDRKLFMAEPLATGGPNRRYPQEGFGFTVVHDPNDKPFYYAFGMHDANAVSTQSGSNTIDDGDYFFGGQFGFTPVIEGWGKGIYRVSGSYSMDNESYGEAWSVMLSFDQDIDPKNLGLFFRYGVSDGDDLTLDQQLGTGVVFKNPFGFKDDRIGIGAFWFGVNQASHNDIGTEVFYRFQLSTRVQLTPDVQFIFPDRNRDFVTVFGMRLRSFF